MGIDERIGELKKMYFLSDQAARDYFIAEFELGRYSDVLRSIENVIKSVGDSLNRLSALRGLVTDPSAIAFIESQAASANAAANAAIDRQEQIISQQIALMQAMGNILERERTSAKPSTRENIMLH